MLNAEKIKADFPIFSEHKKLVYLDNAATSQKPQVVINALVNFYSKQNANVHRGVYELSEIASSLYEEARQNLAKFIGAKSDEIIFTKGTTDSLNMLALSLADDIKKDDEILVADFEHHSNFLPWQNLAKKADARFEILESDKNGFISEPEWQKKLSKKTKIVAIAHASNVLGTIQDIKSVAEKVHSVGALLVVDGAQAIPHLPVDVKELDCDFYAFSGHKMLGPMGIGILYGRSELLQKMNPAYLGGGMINEVTFYNASYAESPEKFEAGTPNVAGAIALSTAADYLSEIGLDKIRQHEIELNEYLIKELKKIERVELLGEAKANQRTGLISFAVKNIHAHDLSDFLAKKGLSLRAGFHCAMPLHESHDFGATLRVSHYLYNEQKDLQFFIESLKEAIEYYG